jgi:hypothetical protein
MMQSKHRICHRPKAHLIWQLQPYKVATLWLKEVAARRQVLPQRFRERSTVALQRRTNSAMHVLLQEAQLQATVRNA